MQYGAKVWAKKKQEEEKAHLTEMCKAREEGCVGNEYSTITLMTMDSDPSIGL